MIEALRRRKDRLQWRNMDDDDGVSSLQQVLFVSVWLLRK